MYEPLVRSRRGFTLLLVGPVAFVGVLVGLIATIPYTFAGPGREYQWVDDRVMAAAGAVCALAGARLIVFFLGRILVAVDLQSALYGRATDDGVELAMFAARFGLLRRSNQHVPLNRDSPVTIRAFGDPPILRILQLQGLVITQESSTLQVLCYVGFSAQSRATLSEWLERNGIIAEITGDEKVLPIGAAHGR